MSTELLNEKDSYDGIVSNKHEPEIKDIYNLGSNNMDVLRLEICKNQNSQDKIVECLTVQQSQLSKVVHSLSMGDLVAWSFIAIFISITIYCAWRLCND